jgi:shikimate kinase
VTGAVTDGSGPAGHVVLVGMMGTGKTTTGRRLAEVLGRRFADSDLLIEADTGRTVRQIFELDGEPAFRELESEVLARALRSPEPTVIAAAGGVVLDPGNRERLRGAGTVVWLRAPIDVLVGRVGRSDHRPAIEADPRGRLLAMEDARTDLYTEVADVVVDSSAPVDEVVAKIVAVVTERELAS